MSSSLASQVASKPEYLRPWGPKSPEAPPQPQENHSVVSRPQPHSAWALTTATFLQYFAQGSQWPRGAEKGSSPTVAA